MKNKKTIKIIVISAQNLPINQSDMIFPYVVLKINGVFADENQTKRTLAIKEQIFDPIWNEEFKFVINCPELAFVRFSVKNENFGINNDEQIGYYAVRIENILPGILNLK